MAASERTYVIPLRAGVMKTPKYKRAKKAVSIIKDFVTRHSKPSDVRIGKHLNLKLWEHGIKNVPCRVKVDVIKDDKGTATAELFGAPKEVKKEESGKGKAKKEEAKATAADTAAAEKFEGKKETGKAVVAAATEATAAAENNQKEPVKQQ